MLGDLVISTIAKLAMLYGYRIILLILLVVFFCGRWELGRLILQAWGILIIPGLVGKILTRLYPPNRGAYSKGTFFYHAAVFIWNGFRLP